MSKVDRLLIQGIRSFEPNTPCVIRIFTPLTLIVGSNGSGKTTIIECLRYATTGELPPNSTMGGAWIHDPKLVGESEVLAQVKLSFFTAGGEYIIVERKLQLTVKRMTRAQKKLEGSLIIKNPRSGQETKMSGRVADLDTMMPQYLGVSKAILDSVIFCHQDDSLWPMSAPAMLKKKFDEIFEAEKYTKAIDNIKSIRKKQMEELGKLKIIHSHAKDDKEKGKRARDNSEKLYAEIEKLRGKHEGLTEQIKDANKQLEAAWDLSVGFAKQFQALEEKRIEARALERHILTDKESLVLMQEPDDELHRMLDADEEDLTDLQAESDKFLDQKQETEAKIVGARQQLGRKQTDVGMFRSEMNQYEKNVQIRIASVQEAAKRHEIRGFDSDITEDHVQKFMDRMDMLVKEQQSLRDAAKQEVNLEVNKVQKTLNALIEHRSSLAQSREYAKQQIDSNDDKIVELQRKLNSLDGNEGNKAVLEVQVSDLETRLQGSKQDLSNSKYADKIETVERDVDVLTKTKDRLEAEIADATMYASDMGEMDYLTKELRNRQTWLDTNTTSYDQEFRKEFNSDWTPENLKERHKTATLQRSDSLRDAEIKRDRLQYEHDKHQFRMTEATRQLEEKRRQQKEHRDIIWGATEVEPRKLPEQMKSIEEALDEMRIDNTGFGNMKDYYQKCMDVVNKQHKCQLCLRGITGDEQRKFIKRLDAFLADAVKKMTLEDQQLLEAELAKAVEVQPNHAIWLQLQDSIPELEKSIRDIEQKQDELTQELESADQVVKDRQSSKRELEGLLKAVQSVVNCVGDIASYNEQLAKLKIKSGSSSKIRPSTLIQEEMKTANNETRRLSSELSQLRSERERKEKHISNLQSEVHNAQSRLMTVLHELKERTGLEEQIRDYKSQNQSYRERLQGSEDELRLIKPRISQAQERLEDVKSSGDERERELSAELSRLQESIGQLSRASQQIDEFISGGGPTALARSTREMEAVEKELHALESYLAKTASHCDRLREELRNHADKKKQIKDNLTYRENSRQIAGLRRDIIALETSNAKTDKERYDREADKWQAKRNELSAKQAHVVGEIKSKDDILKTLIHEWESDYKDAEYKYKEAHVKVMVTEHAIRDLATYAGALDKAVMKYHSLKMEKINRTVDELWRKTYRGSDVDTIMIKSENETQRGNKSYNYRVVMIKGGADMDMRGRCSAGQKVLASIIIRLALAECFSTNCGLIALDEPTTNLDRANIISLATSLNELIKARRAQKNFQLIVITHDEEFLRHMNCAELCDEYFRVSRNLNQKSEIVRQTISEVYR